MKTYETTITFKPKGAAEFRYKSQSDDEAGATMRAIKFAKSCGFDLPIKKVVVTEVK